MENSHNNPNALLFTILTSVLSWFTLINAQYLMSFILTCIGIISGIFAIRYYYYAGEEKKQNLKK